MRLLICTQKVDQNDSNLGFFVRWIAEFAKHCEQVTVICLQKGDYSLPNNVQIFSLGKEKKEGSSPNTQYSILNTLFFSRVQYVLRLLRLAWREREDYETIFVHMNPEYLLVCGWLWKLLGKKVGLWYTHRSTRLLRYALPFVDHVFTPTPDSFPIATKNLVVLSHGIDTNHFTPRVPSHGLGEGKGGVSRPLVILSDTRISRSKHVNRTVELSRLLLEADLSHEIRIVGASITEDDKMYEKELRATVLEQKLPVTFIGGVPYSDLPSVYGAADVFINHGNIGALNKVGLQAMAMNLFVFTSNSSYRGILPDVQLLPSEPSAFCEAILVYARQPQAVSYRDEIIRSHGLTKLIPRILAFYEKQ